MPTAVENNATAHRFEAVVDGRTAFLNYQRHGGVLTLVHTEVPPELEGRGIASSLARAALDYAREQRLRVAPRCPFVATYLERHPEYSDLTGDAE